MAIRKLLVNKAKSVPDPLFTLFAIYQEKSYEIARKEFIYV